MGDLEAGISDAEAIAGLDVSPRGEAKWVRGPRSNTVFFRFFTNHELRNTIHGLFSRASAVGW
ncbi:MAG: hypothetical protein OXH92_19940 [Bryobacterales bacterium]|nr:hypothetical protein [Bryobacterales bacterium]